MLVLPIQVSKSRILEKITPVVRETQFGKTLSFMAKSGHGVMSNTSFLAISGLENVEEYLRGEYVRTKVKIQAAGKHVSCFKPDSKYNEDRPDMALVFLHFGERNKISFNEGFDRENIYFKTDSYVILIAKHGDSISVRTGSRESFEFLKLKFEVDKEGKMQMKTESTLQVASGGDSFENLLSAEDLKKLSGGDTVKKKGKA